MRFICMLLKHHKSYLCSLIFHLFWSWTSWILLWLTIRNENKPHMTLCLHVSRMWQNTIKSSPLICFKMLFISKFAELGGARLWFRCATFIFPSVCPSVPVHTAAWRFFNSGETCHSVYLQWLIENNKHLNQLTTLLLKLATLALDP